MVLCRWDELSHLSLNRMMLGLIQTQFLPDLLANVSEPAGPQQGNIPFCALRIAAFWLSWVRYTFARQLGPQGMCVSASILEKLQGFVGKEGGSTDDLELAQKVLLLLNCLCAVCLFLRVESRRGC